ncbi:MAG: hypothetical protein IT323_16900, partial [Anaerolineae bacterium]|nr:hypothetical protein [Anaerolineae bacterium]
MVGTGVAHPPKPAGRSFAQRYERWKYQAGGISLTSYILRAVLLAALALFFGLPLIWLILAPTKKHSELLTLSPLSFGSFENVVDSWNRLTAYNRGIIFTWAQNTVVYVVVALALVIICTVPA